MLMHFLGYGICHNDQTQFARPNTEVENPADLEEDILDLQNMARIAQDMERIVQDTLNSRNAVNNVNVQPLLNVTENRNDAAIDDAREDDGNLCDEDLYAVSDVEADGDYDLDGNL